MLLQRNINKTSCKDRIALPLREVMSNPVAFIFCFVEDLKFIVFFNMLPYILDFDDIFLRDFIVI